LGKVKAIIQNKGGVGKTTVTCNLAAALARKYPEKKVLIVDTDPQGNQAVSFGVKPRKIENTIYDVLVKGMTPEETIIQLSDNLHLLPSNGDMNYYEIDTMPKIEKIGFRAYLLALKNIIDSLAVQYDHVFIDSPPELKIVALQIMMSADDIYIPFESDPYNAEGLISLLEKINASKRQYNMAPEVRGIILNKVREQTRIHRGVSVQVDAYCVKRGIPILNTKIPFSAAYPTSIGAARMPITWADPKSKHAQYYYDLLEEVLNNG
jgi:chromosome partitioning protein